MGRIFRMRVWLTKLRSTVLSEVEFLKRKKKAFLFSLNNFSVNKLGRARIT